MNNPRRSGLEGHMFEIRCHQKNFTAESLLKIYPSFVICIHNINLCLRCWLTYICFTNERCNMRSMHKRFTTLVATFKKLTETYLSALDEKLNVGKANNKTAAFGAKSTCPIATHQTSFRQKLEYG